MCGWSPPPIIPSPSSGRAHEFREDLLYRINTGGDLRAAAAGAGGDIAPLFEHFVDVYARKYNLPAKRFAPRRWSD